jgi:hypothetical protein
MSVLRYVLLALPLVLATGQSYAAPPSTGQVAGFVTSATTGVAISGALVSASQIGVTKGSATTTTDGSYTVVLSPGTYDIVAGAGNYSSNSQSGVSVVSKAPTIPSDLAATATGSTSITLTWSAASDDIAVTGYTIYRSGDQVGTTEATVTTDSSLSPATSYIYTVDAYDAAGNHSAQSG